MNRALTIGFLIATALAAAWMAADWASNEIGRALEGIA